MKITYNWLRQYVDFAGTPQDLAQSLTMLGLEVEGMQTISGEFDGVVVAEVVTRDRHPNADKLSLCRVKDGRGERQIVCGAQNFKAGDKVPLILPGSSLRRNRASNRSRSKPEKFAAANPRGCSALPMNLGFPTTWTAC